MISVVITTHHDDACCYLTAEAVTAQLHGRGMDYEIIIVADGGTPLKWENTGVTCLRVNTGSPQGSRDVGIRAAKYPNVLVLESHVIVSDIPALLLEHIRLSSQLTFPVRVDEGPEMFDVFAHETNWDGDLWFKRAVYQEVRKVPYPVAQFGHSCFMIDRKWYHVSGGYTNLLTGWGGEEPLLCLKTWMLGGRVWQIPTVWHAHCLTVGAHAEKPHLENNLAIVGYVIAGRMNPKLKITPDIAAERERICRGPLNGDLVLLREYLKKLDVPYA